MAHIYRSLQGDDTFIGLTFSLDCLGFRGWDFGYKIRLQQQRNPKPKPKRIQDLVLAVWAFSLLQIH